MERILETVEKVWYFPPCSIRQTERSIELWFDDMKRSCYEVEADVTVHVCIVI